MPRYSQERKNAVLKKLLPPNNLSVPEVSQAEGISEGALYNWLSQVREGGSAVPGSRASNAEQWSGEAKFAVVLETQPMNEAEKAEYCREKGLYAEQIERWRIACIAGASSKEPGGEPLKEARNEIQTKLVNDKASILAYDAAASFYDQTLEGDDLANITKETDLTVRKTGQFSRQGKSLQGVADRSKFIATAFELGLNQISEIQDLSDGYYLMQVIETVPD